jgi:DNA topoisomerase II
VVDSSGRKIKRKQATLKTRKSIVSGKRGGDSDGDDDFMPTKKAAAAKARKPMPIAPAGGASRAVPKLPKGEDDEMSFGEDDEVLPRPTKKRAAPAAPATKPPPPPPRAESGSDIEMASPRPKKASSSTAKDEDDEDSGDDLIRRALEKGKGKAKATATEASKRKS